MVKRFADREEVLSRFKDNPIITLYDIPFRCNTVFNGAVIKKGTNIFIS